MAGYSGTPLPQKLGIKPASAVVVVGDAPDGFLAGIDVRHRLGAHADVVVAFFTKRRDLERRIEALERAIFPDGGLWVAWPKKASGVATDITEDTLREVALPRGLVDNKVCAIDETWSGLRLVWRKERR
jgi:threonine dehydrogenase-like Zn-dependent dehydrogenase